MDMNLYKLAWELLKQKIAEQESRGILESLQPPKVVQKRDVRGGDRIPAGELRVIGCNVSFIKLCHSNPEFLSSLQLGPCLRRIWGFRAKGFGFKPI